MKTRNATYSWVMTVDTVSEANSSEHWSKKSKRHKLQQKITRFRFALHVDLIKLPCHIHLIRISPRTLDDDNLLSSLKYIRDELSELLIPPQKSTYVTKDGKIIPLKGRQDNNAQLTWSYSQKKASQKAVEVQLYM